MAFLAVHTDPPPGNTLEAERAELARAGATLAVAEGRDDAALIAATAVSDAVINTAVPLRAGVILAMQRCRVIVRTGVGVDNVDVGAATAAGIVVANVPDASVEEVSNHTLGLILACSRKIVRLDRALRAGIWDRRLLSPMGRLHGETLGLVGFGRIARALARKATALGMLVVAADPLVGGAEMTDAGVEPVALEALLARADVVSLHLPLLPETRHLIDAAKLAVMRPSAYLVNTARGGLIDQRALVDALRAGTIAGAGLDVYEEEPLPKDDPLLSLENVVLTPHSAAFSDVGIRELRRRAGEAAADVLLGWWPRGLANPGVTPRRPLTARP